MSFSLSLSLPGTGPGRWIHSRIHRQRYNLFFNYQNFSHKSFTFFVIFFGLTPKSAIERRIFVVLTIKIFSLCLLEKFRAATNGANPAKFTPQKHKRKPKAAPFMHPDTGRKPHNRKRNRDLRQMAKNPYLCGVFFHRIAQQWYLTAAPGVPGAVLLILNWVSSFRRRTIRLMIPITVHSPHLLGK